MSTAVETGTHSPWVSRLLEECGPEVLVANKRGRHEFAHYQKRHQHPGYERRPDKGGLLMLVDQRQDRHDPTTETDGDE